MSANPLFAALEKIDERKRAAFGAEASPITEAETVVRSAEEWRPVYVGLDLDTKHLNELGNIAAANAHAHGLAHGVDLPGWVLDLFKAMATDFFAAGILYDRERGAP